MLWTYGTSYQPAFWEIGEMEGRECGFRLPVPEVFAWSIAQGWWWYEEELEEEEVHGGNGCIGSNWFVSGCDRW